MHRLLHSCDASFIRADVDSSADLRNIQRVLTPCGDCLALNRRLMEVVTYQTAWPNDVEVIAVAAMDIQVMPDDLHCRRQTYRINTNTANSEAVHRSLHISKLCIWMLENGAGLSKRLRPLRQLYCF